jgi:hypothetical protein
LEGGSDFVVGFLDFVGLKGLVNVDVISICSDVVAVDLGVVAVDFGVDFSVDFAFDLAFDLEVVAVDLDVNATGEVSIVVAIDLDVIAAGDSITIPGFNLNSFSENKLIFGIATGGFVTGVTRFFFFGG